MDDYSEEEMMSMAEMDSNRQYQEFHYCEQSQYQKELEDCTI